MSGPVCVYVRGASRTGLPLSKERRCPLRRGLAPEADFHHGLNDDLHLGCASPGLASSEGTEWHVRPVDQDPPGEPWRYVPGHIRSRAGLHRHWQHGSGRPAGARPAIDLDLTRSFVPNDDVYFLRAGWRWRLCQCDGHDRGDHARYHKAQNYWPQHRDILHRVARGSFFSRATSKRGASRQSLSPSIGGLLR